MICQDLSDENFPRIASQEVKIYAVCTKSFLLLLLASQLPQGGRGTYLLIYNGFADVIMLCGQLHYGQQKHPSFKHF